MAFKSNSLGIQKLREKVEKEKEKQTAEKTTKPASNKTNQSTQTSTSDKSGIEKLREKVSANNPDYRIGTPLKMGSTPKPITTTKPTTTTNPTTIETATDSSAEQEPRDANWWDLTVNSAKRGWHNMDYGQESYKQMMGRDNNKDYYEELLKGDDYNFETDTFFEQAVSGAAELIGQQAHQYLDPRTITAALGLGALATVAGQAGPQVTLPEEVVTVPGAVMLGAQAGSAINSFEAETGHAYNELISHGISPDTAMVVANAAGFGSSVLDMIAMDDLVKSFKILKGTGTSSSLTKTVLKFILDRLGHVGTETLTEVGQEATVLAGVDVARGIEGKEPIYSWGEVGERLVDTGVSSAISFGALGAIGDAVNVVSNAPKVLNEIKKQKNENGSNTTPNYDYTTDITTDSTTINEPDTLEKAAMDVVANRNKAEQDTDTTPATPTASPFEFSYGIDTIPTPNTKTAQTASKPMRTALLEMQMEAMSRENEPVTVDEVKKATAFGDSGSVLISELINNEGVPFSTAKRAVETAYRAGFTDLDESQAPLTTDIQKLAFKAGKADRNADNIIATENAQDATVYDGKVEESEYFKKLPSQAQEMAKTLSKDFGMSTRFVDSLIASIVDGEPHYANAQHEDGKLSVADNSENAVHEDLIHEALHRMMQVAPEETGLLLNSLYKYAQERDAKFDTVKSDYGEADISLNTLAVLEEVGAQEIQKLFNSPEAFNEWRAKLDTDANLKKGWAKVVEFINELIEKVKQFVKEIGMTAEEKARAHEQIVKLELYANAYKATMNEVEQKKQNGEQKAQKNTDTEDGKSFNLKYDYSKKSFSDQIDDFLNPIKKARKQPEKDSFLIGATPQVFKDIGFNALPVTINKTHIDYALNGTKDFDHEVWVNVLKKLPEALKSPIIVMENDTHPGRVVAVLKIIAKNQKNIYLPIEIDGTAQNNGIRIDSNAITSLFGRQNVETKIKKALDNEDQGKISVFYWNKKEAITLLQRGRSQLPTRLPQDGFVHSIRENGSNIKVKLNDVTESLQFKRWFGDWQKKAKKASKIVNADGTPKIVYHGTDKDFDVFVPGIAGGIYFSADRNVAEKFSKTGKIKEAYLDIKKPFVVDGLVESEFAGMTFYKQSFYYEIPTPKEMRDAGYTSDTVSTEEIVKYAKASGKYDGIIIENVRESDGDATTDYIVFSSTQVKSATDNIGTFDGNNPNTRFSLKKPVEQTKAEEQAVNALGDGAETVTDKNGDMLIATNKGKNTVMYSLKTYKNGGKKALEKALRANGHTEAEIQETLSYVDDAADYLTILAAGYAKTHNYTALSNHLIADVITNVKTGKQVISSIVNNGEYPVNIDLALICKKRVAYMNLMNRLIDDGVFDKVNYGGEAIAKVNDLLRMDGFETACLGCFVESRRLQFQAWAETIVSEWNAEVDKRKSNAGNFNFADGEAKLTDAELDALAEELKNAGKKNAQGNLNLGKGSVQTKMGRLLDKVPSLQKHLTVADLLKPEGLTALRAYDSNLFSIVKSRYGAASPKIVQDYNPYASEIAMMTFSSVKNITSNAVKGADAYRRKVTNEMGGKPVKQKGETDKAFKERKAEFSAKVEDEAIRRYLYDIGGARIQSFSDFMIENVFDYIQIFADLSAKRLPLHGYTKEIVALRLFGMTGAKWNGSWIAHVDRDMGKEYAGLLPASEAKDGNAILVHTKDGDYAIGFDDYARYKATDKKTFIQSIGMKDMIALQLDPRYSANVGSITIGVSDKQILAMLDSPLFRFVIPYHSSGMLPQFAKLVGVDLYNDYTDYQNTTVKQWYDAYGNPCEPIRNAKNEVIDVDTSYNFNAEVQKTGDAKKAADNYLKWCGNQHPVYDQKKLVGYVTFNPKFSDSPYGTDFSKHENYYKMLEDFNSYDSVTEKSAVQSAVTMNFPSEENRLTASEMEAYKARLRETGLFSDKEIEKYSAIADKTFKELIADEVKGRAEYQKAQTPKWENTVKNVEDMLLADHKRNFSLKKSKTTPSPEAEKFLADLKDMENGDEKAVAKLSKYVDSGVITTKLYNSLIEKYGAIHEGENPYREVQVPKKTEKDKKVSQTVRTILEARATPDEVLPTIEKMVEDGVFSYDVYTDKQAIKDKEDYLNEYGWDESLDDWMKDVNNGVVSKQHTVLGWALYNNAVNTAATTTSESERKTAMRTALKVLDAMVRHQRSAAQALQATRVLKKMSPETQLYGIQQSVSSMQRELADKYGKKAPDLKIDEELAENFLNAKTEDERVAAEIEIYKNIGKQMPSDLLDMWNAWRYVAMLTNPRTHIRNIVGNAGFVPVVLVKDMTAAAIENVVYRVSGKKMLRGKALVLGSKTDRELLSAAWKDYANVADMISNGGKYNDSAMANKYIEDSRAIFKSEKPVLKTVLKPLEFVRKANSKALEVEDMWFSMPHYAYALAQYCKANNITAEQIRRGKAIAPAREYAIKEAQKATYKDTNALSHMVSGWGRSGGKKNGFEKAVGVAIEGILPFRKTPANILVRGLEYSPIGLIKSLSYDLVQVSKGKMTATEAIDNISAGLTGAGLFALGIHLAAMGLIRGGGTGDKDEKEFEELMGHQPYSLELPNGESRTLDWLAPQSLPFFTGVRMWEISQREKKNITLSDIMEALSAISDPMLEMSFIQGLNDAFKSVGYAQSNEEKPIAKLISSVATSYFSQAIPTILGQAERTGEENRMTTYTEKNNFLTSDAQYTLGKWSAKIPFVDFQQIPYIDAWGRKEASGTALKRGFNNFLNPAYTSTIETSDMEKELLRLYEQTGEGSVFPSRADKYFIVDGKRKDLTADEYVRYATLKGEKSYKLITDLTKSEAYQSLDDGEKVKAIEEAYDYANQKAKQAISNYKPEKWVGTADKFGSSVGNYLAFRADVSDTKTDNGGDISKTEVTNIALQFAQTDSEIWNMYLSMYDNYGATYAKENGVEGETYMNFVESLEQVDKPTESGEYGTYTQEEAKEAIKNLTGLSKQDKAILWQSVNKNWKAKNNPFK